METKEKKKFNLEERLIEFAVLNIQISDSLIESRAANHIAGQIVRSGTHPALHYGEAQSAESRQDFIHKLKVLLKELRETSCAMKIIKKACLANAMPLVEKALAECNELISIFVKSISTAQENQQRELKENKGKTVRNIEYRTSPPE